MSVGSDNQDKTVFRQPINRGDGSVVRPMPGGRAAHSQPSNPGMQQSAPQPAVAPAYRPPFQNIPEANFQNANGLNPIINAASTLLAVFSKTREALTHPNIGALHQQLDREIKAFDINARAAGVKEDDIILARYLLCTILDEAVLNTPWGADSAWNQRTLLVSFHNETSGGEKFFAIVDRLRQTPAENIEVLELVYLCLSLGYEGKFRIVARGRDHLEQLRDDLFYIIRSYRGEYERSLSPSWKGIGNTKKGLSHYIPMWVVASFFIGVMALTYSGFRYWILETSTPLSEQLSTIQNVAEQTKGSASATK